MGLEGAVHSLTRPRARPASPAPRPTDGDGDPIAPPTPTGHDHLWWLDRMVRANQQLVERMALVFHDWFATSHEGVDSTQLMIDQSNLFRNGGFGLFRDLLENVTKDPAMLRLAERQREPRDSPNENYARELMELFTLGADRGGLHRERRPRGWPAR